MLKRAIETLEGWALDWRDRSGAQPSDRKIESPLTLVPSVFAALAGIAGALASPAIKALAPDLNANAALILRIIIAVLTLIAANYVVTAKDKFEVFSGIKSELAQKYRYSTTERLIARGVVILAILIWILTFVPAPIEPRDCSVNAVVTWSEQLDGTAKPIVVSLMAGGEQRYPVERGRPVAMQVPAAHLSKWSLTLLWSDGSRSDFGEFAGCPSAASKGSVDARAEVKLTGR